METSTLPKGQSKERTKGQTENEPGIYVHKPTGKKLVTRDGEAGIIQADAIKSPVWKDQWERVGDVPSGTELLKMRKAQALKDAKSETDPKVKKELELFGNS